MEEFFPNVLSLLHGRYNSTVFIQDCKVGFLNKFGMKNSGVLVFIPVYSFLAAEIAYLLDDYT